MKKKLMRIEDCIGGTPIVELQHDLIPENKHLYLKLEWFSPTFSIKDRTAIGLVKSAFDTGKLKPNDTLIESTSGNLGKSLAMLGAVYKFKVVLVVDPKISIKTLNWYKAYGAEIIMVHEADENGGYQAARIREIKKFIAQHPQAYWPNQYDNQANSDYHYQVTGKEIAESQVDAVFGAISTGGHLCGIARRIKQEQPNTSVIACDIEGSAIFADHFKPYLINGVGLAWRSHNTDLSVLDRIYIASDQEAISTCRVVANDAGILMGGSGGLVVFCALAWLEQNSDTSVLAIIPDSGVNYLDQIYDDEWLAERKITLLTSDNLKSHIRNKQSINLQTVETEA